MKVLSVVNTLNRGGVEVQLLQAIPFLVDRGISMDICTVGPGVLEDQFRSLGCRIHRIRKSFNCFETATAFSRILKRNSYDGVHCNFQHSSGGYALGASRSGIACAVSFHSAHPTALYRWKNRPVLSSLRNVWLRWHRHLIDKHAQILVGHSQVNIRNYAPAWEANPARYRVISNGINFASPKLNKSGIRAELSIRKDELVLLHVGRIRDEKNHLGLLEIFKHVLKQHPATTLICAGGGNASALRQVAERAGIADRVRLVGEIENVWPYYVASDVFVFPSVTEGFGNVLVESQGATLPVVASDIEPHRESVAPSQHRFLFSLPDYRRAADLVLEQADASQRMSNDWVKQAQTHVRSKFSIERFASDLRDLYFDLAENKYSQPQTVFKSQSVGTSDPLSSRAA